MATVTDAVVALSYNYHSDSSLTLKGSGFTKGSGGTLVQVFSPATGTPVYEWKERVHKISADGTKAEVKLRQQNIISAAERKKEMDTTDTVRIVVDSSSTKNVTAELYVE
jgi:hypothetical protein